MTGSPDRALAALLLGALALTAGCSDRPPPTPQAPGPARRIVTLAPSLTELAYAAGAGPHLVGAVEFSNTPAEARALPRVGDAFRLDLEALAALRPDLVLGWPSGNSRAALDRLRRLGYRVVDLEPRRLADVGDQIERIGALAGSATIASAAAREWRDGLTELKTRHAGTRTVRVFYQVAPQPLLTVSREHYIGEAIELCGGQNVFADVPGLTPVVGVEAVVAAAPDVIVVTDFTVGPGRKPPGSPLDPWRRWTGVPAVASGRLHVVDPDLMSVPGPRLLEGIRRLCAAISPEVPRAAAAKELRYHRPPGTAPAT